MQSTRMNTLGRVQPIERLRLLPSRPLGRPRWHSPVSACTSPTNVPHAARRRRGLSLLEIILALALLAGFLTMLSDLVSVGTRSAAEARDLTRAQLICESILNEIVIGATPAEAVQQAAVPGYEEWFYSVMILPLEEESLESVQVTVFRNDQSSARPVEFSLTRWMIDPEIEEAASSQYDLESNFFQ